MSTGDISSGWSVAFFVIDEIPSMKAGY